MAHTRYIFLLCWNTFFLIYCVLILMWSSSYTVPLCHYLLLTWLRSIAQSLNPITVLFIHRPFLRILCKLWPMRTYFLDEQVFWTGGKCIVVLRLSLRRAGGWNSFSYVLSHNTRFSTLEFRASSSFCNIIIRTLLYLVVTYSLRHDTTAWNKGTPWLCCSSRHNSDVVRSHSFDGNSLSLIRGSSHKIFARTRPPKFH